MVITFAEPVTIPDGGRLQLTLEQTHSNDHNIGCFKVSVAKDVPTNTWTAAKPANVTATGDTVLTVRPDNSVLASGPNNTKGTFAIDIPARDRVTGVRIDALPDPSLPLGGPGRAPNGNFVITEVKGQVILPDGSRGRTVKFTHAADWQARTAVRNMFLGLRERAGQLLIPWCTYTEPEIAHVG